MADPTNPTDPTTPPAPAPAPPVPQPAPAPVTPVPAPAPAPTVTTPSAAQRLAEIALVVFLLFGLTVQVGEGIVLYNLVNRPAPAPGPNPGPPVPPAPVVPVDPQAAAHQAIGLALAKQLPAIWGTSLKQAKEEGLKNKKPLDQLRAEHYARWDMGVKDAFTKLVLPSLDQIVPPGTDPAKMTDDQYQQYLLTVGSVGEGALQAVK